MNVTEQLLALRSMGADPIRYLVTPRFLACTLLADVLNHMADNFARAAAKSGVKQILYLGGLIPDGPELSRHLLSRLEVE